MNSRPELAVAIAAASLASGCATMCNMPTRDELQNRLAMTASENRSLRRELDEAQAKIKALTEIERTLDAPQARTPGKE
jgi:hypothetical protein